MSVSPRAPWTWSGVAVVAAVAIAVYVNSLDGALMYDDTNAIVRNRVVVEERWGDILTTPSWWRPGLGRGWRPVTTTSFALNHAVHGLEPRGYHVVNVALHAAVSALVVTTFAAVTGHGAAALVAGVLFAAHPVHTEAVASVVGRSELLAALAFFVGWMCFLQGDRQRRLRWDTAGVLVFFTGLLAKENTITLLPALVLTDLLVPREPEGPRATLRQHAGRYAAMLVAVLVYVGLRQSIIGSGAPGPQFLDNPLIRLSLDGRLLTAIAILWRYAVRLAAPFELAADYSYDQIPAVTSPLDASFLAGLAVLVAVPALGWWTRRRLPAAALGLGVLAVTFSLVANLAFPIGTIMAERLIYLPSAGFCLLAGAALAHLAGRGTRGPRLRELGLALVVPVAIVVALYAVRTVTRNEVWHDRETFFTTMAREAPRSARSHRELGTVLTGLGRHADASRAFERSLAILPDDAATLYNHGNALVAAGEFDRAAAAYERAVAVKPDFVDAIMNLATAEERRGNQAVAIAWLTRGLTHQPGHAGLHMNLANAYFRIGQRDAARASYEAALAADPRDELIRMNYGMFLIAERDFERAIGVYGPASSVSARAAAGLVTAHAALGNWQAARDALAQAQARFPGDPTITDLERRFQAAQ